MKRKTPLHRVLRYRLLHAGRLATARWRKLPDFLIIGAAKSGTTSLYNYLIQHPCVQPCFRKEVHFFDRKYDKGVDWYRSFFPLAAASAPAGCPATRTGESSPYYLFHPLAPQRVRRVLPGARFFVLLRNPVDRAVSHYNHRVRAGQETLPIEEAFDAEAGRLAGEGEKLAGGSVPFSFNHYYFSYLSRGRYAGQLENWFGQFPRERFLVLDSDALFREPGPAFRQALQHLGLEDAGTAKFEAHNTADKDRYATLPAPYRKQLVEMFRKDNEKLFGLLGRRFEWDK